MLYLIKSLIKALLLVVIIAARIVISLVKIIVRVIVSLFSFVGLLFKKIRGKNTHYGIVTNNLFTRDEIMTSLQQSRGVK